MKKNLFAIETAIALILIGMLIAGIVLKEFVVTWLSVGFIVLGGLIILIYKIIKLAKSEIDEQNNESSEKSGIKKLLFNTKKAWQFSTNGERIKSLLFIFTFLLCCITFIILCSYGYVHAALGVIFGGLGVIIISIIIMAIIDKMIYKKYIDDLSKPENTNEIAKQNKYAVQEQTVDTNSVDIMSNDEADNKQGADPTMQ